MNQNCWNGVGRLTRDAEEIETKTGNPMSKFRLAVNNRGKKDDTLFIDVLCFGKTAENLNPFLVKGRLVTVTGAIKNDDYKDKDDNVRNSFCVFANDVSLGPESQGRDSPD